MTSASPTNPSTASSSVWDNPELAAGGEYVKFEEVGDTIVGDVLFVGIHRFDDQTAAPKLIIRTDDGEERTLTAGQVRLSIKLRELRPEAGDRIKITYTLSEKRSGGKTLKHFDVKVTKGGAKNATPAQAPEEEF